MHPWAAHPQANPKTSSHSLLPCTVVKTVYWIKISQQLLLCHFASPVILPTCFDSLKPSSHVLTAVWMSPSAAEKKDRSSRSACVVSAPFVCASETAVVGCHGNWRLVPLFRCLGDLQALAWVRPCHSIATLLAKVVVRVRCYNNVNGGNCWGTVLGHLVCYGRGSRVFENRVVKRICGHKRDEVTWDWRQLHSEELHTVCSSPDIIRTIKAMRMW
jgi:hypothetical protein